MPNGVGAQMFCGSFYTVAGSSSHIEGGWGAQSFHSLKGRHEKFCPVLRGGGVKRFGPAIFPFLRPPLPVINERSLKC